MATFPPCPRCGWWKIQEKKLSSNNEWGDLLYKAFSIRLFEPHCFKLNSANIWISEYQVFKRLFLDIPQISYFLEM